MTDSGDPFREDWAAGRTMPVAGDASRCLWCRGELAAAEGGTDALLPAACDACAAVLTADNREPLSSFIEKVDAPLLVVTDNARVEMANARARVFLGKTADALVGRLGGEVIECVHAAQPGGCGGTEHCSGCTLRRSVQHTHATGEPLRVHSYHDVRTAVGVRTAWFEIATERAGELVLLRVSQIGLERRT